MALFYERNKEKRKKISNFHHSRVKFGFHYSLFKGDFILEANQPNFLSEYAWSCGCRRFLCSQMRPSSTLNHPNSCGRKLTSVLRSYKLPVTAAREVKQNNWKVMNRF